MMNLTQVIVLNGIGLCDPRVFKRFTVMRNKITTPTDMMSLWMSYGTMMLEAQSVVAFRMMGMSGAWSVPKGENSAMVAEKVPAFVEAMTASSIAAMSGKAPDKVMQAAITPLTREARSNRKRLAKRGPKRIGKT